MTERRVPPGWPPSVPPPEAAGWERRAVGWLLDRCPPEYREVSVITRHPVVLAWLALAHARAGEETARRALATARVEVGDAVRPPALDELLEALEGERVRCMAVGRAAELLGDAFRGKRYVPRL